MNNGNHLPSELISLILRDVDESDLYACTLIDKSFHRESTPLLWRRLDIATEDCLCNLTTMMKESPRSLGELVRTVTLDGSSVTDETLLAFIKHVPFLEHLTLSYAYHVTDTSFQYVPGHCPNLTYLSIAHSPITQRSMVAIGQHCHQLAEIHLYYCRGLDTDLFTSLASGCPQLTHFKLRECDLEGMADPQKARKAALDVQAMHQLTLLHIWDYNYDFTSFLTIQDQRPLAWPHLTELCLAVCSGIDNDDDAPLVAFIRLHPYLTFLELDKLHGSCDQFVCYHSDADENERNNNLGVTERDLSWSIFFN
ncbi:hypothetical protein BCR42DRAFT_456751 [Absidia repens]|uniref:Uncharacterized protein n=1 Tax=Absidia repens TaxID=90262 RepID=A0A1X2HYR2_9FUNG|nr:hypothetical protein BCR42DRAFT_456751 [Absidia repens]